MESSRKAVKERVLGDMLGSVVDSTGGGWKVLILDEFTTRVLSSTLRMSDIMECNVSVVEDLAKAREPLHQPAVYFIQPTSKSIARLLEDFGGPEGKERVGKGGLKQLYPTAHIFLSNKLPAEQLEKLKANPRLVKSLKTLKELNLEFLTVDSRTVVTDHPDAGRLLLSDACEVNRTAVTRQVDAVVSRLVTLFSTLKEFPVIRYKAPRPLQAGDPPGHSMRVAMPQQLATRLHERLAGMQRAGQLPGKETCDLLVLDRSYDPVAPFIHEWSYEALVYDLVHMEGNVYRYDVESKDGKSEPREAILEESDELWNELRHLFIADVYTTLHRRLKDFQNNKAAKAAGGLGKAAEGLSTSAIRQLIVALPQFREALGRLALHISVSDSLKAATNARRLTDVGGLEQDLVLGEKRSKEMLAFLTENAPALDPTDKLRLLACYLATHPGKLDVAKRLAWQKTAGLSGEDMAALVGGLLRMGVRAMEAVAAPAEGSKGSGFFGGAKKPPKPPVATRRKWRPGSVASGAAAGKAPEDEEEEYELDRFRPLMGELVEEMAAGRLSEVEYPYVKPPSAEAAEAAARAAATSARTARSGLNWARKNKEGGPEGAGGSGSGAAGGGGGRRLVVFILGGATRGEMRVAHVLSSHLGRDVVLASTAVASPSAFVDDLYAAVPESGHGM
ncbi:VPS45 protein [Gonium pectorale]|uniref:VPS45 protein n=1 Tax=Gonium pectorale TaxID=33097 RepID=A0A150G294_GONPE|nr:VPS45 protein [Gonium pectorale]|eukprot:KXZ43944.1 VPS45 protein [Gonium pectorale]